jgi:hypothetical protein
VIDGKQTQFPGAEAPGYATGYATGYGFVTKTNLKIIA